MELFKRNKTPIKIKNLKIIIGNKLINMIRESNKKIVEFQCIMGEAYLNFDESTGHSVINCKDTEERLINLDGDVDEIKLKKDMNLYIVNIMYTGNSFNVLATDEEDAKIKLIEYLKFNSSTYPNYENITFNNLAVIPVKSILSLMKNSDMEVFDISRFGY